jgi:predicted amidohydrolase
MFISIFGAQFPITFDIRNNLDQILEILKNSKKYDLVVFPEGCISGYDLNLSFLENVDSNLVNYALETLREEAIKRKIHLWLGTCISEKNEWFNTAFGFTPKGDISRYNKVNLATHERGVFTFGSKLLPFKLKFTEKLVNIGVQLCRDLKYPEQWRWLAQNNVQVFVHMNYAKGNDSAQTVWKSQLISRATENQKFVISVNAAAPHQDCPTIIINPKGEILKEIISDETRYFRVKINLDLVSDWYIKQSRTDLIEVKNIKN